MEYKSQTRRRGPPLTYPECCDQPEPRIGEQTGRIFCASCRRYLDTPPPAEDPNDGADYRIAEGDDEQEIRGY